MPLKLPVDDTLFAVPRNLIKSFNLDSPYGERPPAYPKRTSAAEPLTFTPLGPS